MERNISKSGQSQINQNNSWALATLSVSNMRALPDDTSELVSQVMMGTPLQVTAYKDKFYRVETPEHYFGWMDAKGLQLLTEQEMGSWKKSDRFFYTRISGFAHDTPGSKDDAVTDLVLGDLFEVESSFRGYLKMKIPDGRTGYVRKADCIPFDDWTCPEPDVRSLLSVARQMMGSPYLWGGTSSKGTDCSGFVKLVYFSSGIILARDSSQQALYGEPVDFSDLNNLQPGDLLFFGSSAQRISHVGIYLGKGDFIHSSGRVQISSILPGDPKHDPSRINIAARRILSSQNTEGITRVKDHPWYTVTL
ncbi:MAG TPA: SH3 domain-containing C40 family peptidase [Bacteroidales bacterium]|nr:SH3 domain-containing C40 family peptidase [Bacteroidales bacterium]HNS45608.1 SH3 domain-containing C40 family peptidase [Bacteroidales bacterium]